jgi:hypothetical protein
MNTIPLLKDKNELDNSTPLGLPRLVIHEGDATPGCTCDRWGHPCARCDEHKQQPQHAQVTPKAEKRRE